MEPSWARSVAPCEGEADSSADGRTGGDARAEGILGRSTSLGSRTFVVIDTLHEHTAVTVTDAGNRIEQAMGLQN